MRYLLRRGLRVACVVLVEIAAVAPAAATTVSVLLTGVLSVVDDSNSVTDGSLSAGVPYALTLSYDDTVGDIDSDPLYGTYLIPAATASYTISVGNYQFDSDSLLNIGLLDGYYSPTEDTLGWFADQFKNSGVLDPGVVFGSFGYSNVSLTDYTGTALSSDRLTDANWDRSRYKPDNQAFHLFVEVLDPSTTTRDYVELWGTIDLMTVVPEPGTSALLILGAAGAALIGRRR